MSDIWLERGKLVVDDAGKPILCDACPCVTDNHLASCNALPGQVAESVPGSLLMTVSFNGITIDVPLYWVESSSACIGAEGWTYGAVGDVAICSGFDFTDASLCCGLDDPDEWAFEFVYKISGILQSLRTGSGIDPVVIVTSVPVYWTTTIPGMNACSVTDDVLIDFQPLP